MPGPRETVWKIQPHTKAKHAILRCYLGAWFPILSSYHGRIVYIDGFAGPGRYAGGEPGSPVVALDVAINHHSGLHGELVFWFIDEREDRINHLRRELQGRSTPPHFKLKPDCGSFHLRLGELLDALDAEGSQLAPTFAFIDPFGFSGVPYILVARLLRRPRCEALITFMADALNRFLEHPSDTVVQHIVDLFGTEKVRRLAGSGRGRIRDLRTLYQKQLALVARFVRYFEMRDRQDRPRYYLFFATNNQLGHYKMKEAMWRVAPGGDFRFSDATIPGQLALFEADAENVLASQLRDKFAGKGYVSGAQLRQFVKDETAYLTKHLTAALRAEEDAGRVEVAARRSDGKLRRAGTYPDEAAIRFT